MTVAANKPCISTMRFQVTPSRKLSGIPRKWLRLSAGWFGSCDPDSLLSDIRYLVMTHEVKWIVLDHLSILLSGNESNDERKMIDVVMTKLRSSWRRPGSA